MEENIFNYESLEQHRAEFEAEEVSKQDKNNKDPFHAVDEYSHSIGKNHQD